MKTYLRTLSLSIGILTLAATSQAQTINGWGNDSDSIGGTTIVDSGSGGNFTVSGTPTGSADFRAAIPSTTLSVGQVLTFSGSFSFTAGSIGGSGGIRIGVLDFGTLGTLTGTAWSTTSADTSVTGYWFGPSAGGNQQSNPGGGTDIVRKPTGANNAWYSGSGGGGVGTVPANAGNITPGTYTFSLSLSDLITGTSISFSLLQTSGGTYSNVGTVLDTAGTVPLTFNSVGFFANTSDTAFASPGVSFSGVSEQVTAVPEPASMTLLGLGALVGTFVIRRKK